MKRDPIFSFLASLFALAVAPLALAQGGTLLFADDFEGWLPAQSFIPDADTFYPVEFDGLRWNGKPGGGGDTAELPAHTLFRPDTENVLGQGPDNVFMQWGNAGTIDIGGQRWIIGDKTRLSTRDLSVLATLETRVESGVLAVGFEFYEPAEGSSNGLAVVDQRSFLRIRGNSVDGTASTNINGFRIDDGIRDPSRGTDPSGEAVTTPGTLYSVFVVFNVSGAAYSYRGPDGNAAEVAAGRADLWLRPQGATGGQDWSLAIDEHVDGDGFGEAYIERVYWELDYPWGPASAQEIWIDDWQVWDGVAVDEGGPTTRVEGVSIAATGDDAVTLRWPTEPGATYQVVATADFASDIAWDPLGPPFDGSGAELSYTHVLTPAERAGALFFAVEASGTGD